MQEIVLIAIHQRKKFAPLIEKSLLGVRLFLTKNNEQLFKNFIRRKHL
jgi:hypothetical protein